MAARKRTSSNAGQGCGESDLPEAVKPSQISSIALIGDAPDLGDGAGVTDYLLAYVGRKVSFYNPLTGTTDERPAAEVIALQMIIGALHGDKSAINRFIERTDGRIGIGAPAAKLKPGADDPRAIAMQVEADRVAARDAADDARAFPAETFAIHKIPSTVPAAVSLTAEPRTSEESIM